MLIVITIIPAMVPIPKTKRYATAQRGSRMVASTRSATAADPAIPCTMPIINGRRVCGGCASRACDHSRSALGGGISLGLRYRHHRRNDGNHDEHCVHFSIGARQTGFSAALGYGFRSSEPGLWDLCRLSNYRGEWSTDGASAVGATVSGVCAERDI